MANNNWYVITGGPHSGKTSVLKLLEKMGYRVVHEAARLYIDQEMEKGKTLEEIRADELEFQKAILDMKIEIEKNLPKEEVIFFDRGIPDSHAYYKFCNYSDDEHLEEILKQSDYKKVFLFELLDYEKDYARTESEAGQKELQALLRKSYEKIAANIHDVPKMESKEDRLEYILRNL